MLPGPVPVESQHNLAVLQACLGPRRFKVKGYVAQVSDEIDFVGVQLQSVRGIPPRDGGGQRFTVTNLQESLDQFVNRREIVTPDRRQILTPYSRCLKRQESFPVSMISQ